MVVYGTRPEAVKVAPLISAINRSSTLRAVVTVTGQHREMLDQINTAFSIAPDHDLNIFKHGQSLADLMSRTIEGIAGVLKRRRVDALVVQGDTVTSTAAALAGFFAGIPVVHLEAGLRSGDLSSPFPEEANRRITSQISTLHLAPTSTSRDNLLRENIDSQDIVITGNTVIDALLSITELEQRSTDPELQAIYDSPAPLVLVTTHRRENQGAPMAAIARAIRRLADARPHTTFLVPLHKNPVVRRVVVPVLTGAPNIVLTEPLDYAEFAIAMRRARVVLTDSGGVQEEAPTLGKPVLVLRDTTERPEAVAAGTVALVGTDEHEIVRRAGVLLDDEIAYEAMANRVNPYGDGLAATRAVAAIEAMLGVGSRLPDFHAASLAVTP